MQNFIQTVSNELLARKNIRQQVFNGQIYKDARHCHLARKTNLVEQVLEFIAFTLQTG
jgi:hypothetical protein